MDYACSEVKRRITEALIQDDRIESVSDFSFNTKNGTIETSFIVHTIYGEMSMAKDVEMLEG